jgi:hypothetical protein
MMRSLGLASVFGILAVAPAVGQGTPTWTNRPLVLLVHGRGQLDRDSSVVRREWTDGLAAGMRELTTRPLLDTSDVRFVWYADVLDPLSPEGCAHHETNPRSGRLWYNRPGVQAIWNDARRWLVRKVNSVPKADSVVTYRVMGDVYLFLSDLWKRCGTETRLLNALRRADAEQRPVIIVAHSLGSLVVYSYLAGRQPGSFRGFDIRRLVTIGSMLSVPEVYRAILGSMVNPPIPAPAEIKSWVNVRDGLDYLAFDLGGIVGGHPGSAPPRDVATRGTGRPWTAHDAAAYLRDAATSRAIAWAWCRAFSTGSGAQPTARRAPAGCADVVADAL